MAQSVLYGDWEEFKLWTVKIKSADYQKKYTEELTELGRWVVDQIRSHVIKQDLPWKPLAAYTVKQKGHSLVYVDTAKYMKGITSKVKKKSKAVTRLVVFPKGKHGPSGLSMEQLGLYLEYGTSKSPARPIWRPTAREMLKSPPFKRLVDLESKFGFGSV